MSSKEHRQRFFIQTMSGLLLNAAGIAIIFYACFTRNEGDWKFWALITAVIISIGLLLIGNGIVHKVKADFIRKQKGRFEKKEEGIA